MTRNAVLQLLVRDGCHLCETALELLAQLALPVQQIDIEDELELEVQYGLRIPVLRAGPSELDWPFDDAAVQKWLAQVQA